MGKTFKINPNDSKGGAPVGLAFRTGAHRNRKTDIQLKRENFKKIRDSYLKND